MANSIKIIVPNKYEKQLDAGIAREVEDVQKYFDKTEFEFNYGEISFIFLKGFYQHIKRKMTVVGVYVNKTDHSLYELKSSLRLRFQNISAEIATMHMLFPSDFIGEIKPNEGMLVHIEVPVRSLKKDQKFDASDMAGELFDVEITYPSETKA